MSMSGKVEYTSTACWYTTMFLQTCNTCDCDQKDTDSVRDSVSDTDTSKRHFSAVAKLQTDDDRVCLTR